MRAVQRAVIFDLDGLLIDSEPHWRDAEQEVFASVGLELDEADCHRTTGLRVDEVVRFWRRERPWSGADPSDDRQLIGRIVAAVGSRIRQAGEALPGAVEAVDACAAAGVDLAVASSSPMELILASLDRLDLREQFSVLCSAVDEERGKPDPAVYSRAVERLGLRPSDCLALEDSLAGVRAARAAGLEVWAVPQTESARRQITGLGVPCWTALSELEFGSGSSTGD